MYTAYITRAHHSQPTGASSPASHTPPAKVMAMTVASSYVTLPIASSLTSRWPPPARRSPGTVAGSPTVSCLAVSSPIPVHLWHGDHPVPWLDHQLSPVWRTSGRLNPVPNPSPSPRPSPNPSPRLPPPVRSPFPVPPLVVIVYVSMVRIVREAPSVSWG